MGTARTAASKTVGLEPQVVADRASWIDRVPIYGVLLFVFLLGCHEMEDPDLWWHLRTGQLIFARGVLPTTDWYTYGDPDARWIDIYWFWQVIMAGVERWAGIPGIVVATSLMGTATFAILLLPANRTRVSPSVAAMLAIVPVMLFADRYPARPESFSFLLLSAALVVCHLASERPSLVWLLPVIQVLWANTHGSFMLGVAVVGCFAAESVVLAIWNRGQTRPRQPTWMVWILVGLACLLACLVNPYGADAFRLVLVLYARLGSGETAQFYQRLAAEFLGFSGYVQQQEIGRAHV